MEKNSTKKVYGARTKDKIVLKESTSGGIFTAISNYVLCENGFVCGAVFSSEYKVQHIISNTIKDRDRMRGAKYVQSDMGTIILTIIDKLKNNRIVLFTGTPCQVAAVKKIASNKNLDKNLLTVDIICHGVPSPGVFEKHIREIEEKYGKICKYEFRDKNKGWKGQNVTIITEKGTVSDEDAKVFSSLYFNSLIIRPSCHNCKFASMDRVGDITIGDFWGIDKEKNKLNDNLGVSEILLNTTKGENVFEMIKSNLDYFKIDSDSYIQPNMKAPTLRNAISYSFWNKYNKEGIGIGKKFLKTIPIRMLPYRIISKIRRTVGKNDDEFKDKTI